jgi:hypothetical protein
MINWGRPSLRVRGRATERIDGLDGDQVARQLAPGLPRPRGPSKAEMRAETEKLIAEYRARRRSAGDEK